MRSDMKYIVIERPRRGHAGRNNWPLRRPRRVGDEWEGHHKMEGMSRASRWHRDHKELSDNLNPLYRYLDKQEGRPWNDVYSEMSQSLDRRSVQGFHVWSHVETYVIMHARIIDGVPHELNMYGRERWVPVQGLYIDPEDGILKKRGDKYPRFYGGPFALKPDERWKIRSLSPTERLEWIEGIWYRVTLGVVRDTEHKTVHEYKPDGTVLDVLIVVKKKGDMIAVSKKQLNKKELKEHGVRNG